LKYRIVDAGNNPEEICAASEISGHYERRTLFRRSVDIGRNELAVPVHLLRGIGLITEVNRDSLAFLETKQWTRELPVVSGDREDAVGGQFDGAWLRW
jgi:hypothetical protein